MKILIYEYIIILQFYNIKILRYGKERLFTGVGWAVDSDCGS